MLRIPLSELQKFALEQDAAVGLAAGVVEGDSSPLLDALDAALFRKAVSPALSWREWNFWASDAALRALRCVGGPHARPPPRKNPNPAATPAQPGGRGAAGRR